MPGYHVVFGARSMMNGDMMELLSSMRPGRMAVYQWNHPLGAFLWPMNTMQRLEEEKEFDYDQLETYLMQSDYYWIGRVYKSHSGLLDAYIKFKGEGRVTRYILEYDPETVTMAWPQPCDFYLANKAIRTQETMTLAEYNAVEPMAPPPAPMAPPVAATIPATIDEGGSVFLCKGLFLFVFHFSPGPDSPFSFLIVRLFPFLGFLSLSYLASNLIISISLLSRFSTTAFWSLVSTSTFGFETLSSNFHGSICFLRFSSYAFSVLVSKGFYSFCSISIFL